LQHLVAPDGAANDHFGSAAAMAGNTLALGSPFDEVNLATDAGTVYVYVMRGAQWQGEAKLAALDATSNAHFGQALALESDTLLVGAYNDDPTGAGGAVYAFSRSGSVWSETQKILPAGTSNSGAFGQSVDLSGDLAVVGAPATGGAAEGSAQVYVRSSGIWSLQATLLASPQQAGEGFGHTVAIDSDTIAVGKAPGTSGDGRVHVFRHNGSSWNLEAIVQSANGPQTNFGIAVDLEGDLLALGSFRNPSAGNKGIALLYRRNGTSWALDERVKPPAPANNDYFGAAVSLHGQRLLVGAPAGDPAPGFSAGAGPDSGYAYLFAHDGTSWLLDRELHGSSAGAGDQFAIALAHNDQHVLLSARFDDNPTDAGGAFLYRIGGDVELYGSGLAGTSGFVPQLHVQGCPIVGQEISIEVSQALGGTFGVLMVGPGSGAAPFRGGSLLVFAHYYLPHLLGGAPLQPGAGTASLPYKIVDPGLAGRNYYMQGAYVDPNAVEWVSLTQGLRLLIE
jgi:hypothetical protein